MAAAYGVGDRVQIKDRDATADDVKSGLFYDHFRGLTGTLSNLYSNDEAAVEIEPDSLDEPVAKRHLDVQEAMKSKWLDGLSEEARSRLSDKERDFRLRYTILVKTKDLVDPGSSTTPGAKAIAAKSAAQLAAAEQSARLPAAPDTPASRATSADLAAAEEAELQRRRNGS